MDNANTAAPDERHGWVGWIQIAGIIAVIALALFLTAILAMTGGNSPGVAPERAATPVRIVQPEPGVHTVTLNLTGSVTPPAQVSLTPQVGGRIVDLSPQVRAGAEFEANTALFTIDPRDYTLALSRSQAAVADAQSALDQLIAEADINRAEWAREYPDREITPLAAREPQLRAARARLASAQADAEQAQLNLERTRIQLPFAGRVIESRIETGQLVSAGQNYGAVYALDRLEIIAPVPPADLARLEGAIGRNVELTLTETGEHYTGQIIREGAQLDPRTRFIDLFIKVEDDRDLRPGQFVTVAVTGPQLTNIFSLPSAALIGMNKIRIVRSGVIEEVSVTVLDRTTDLVITEPFDPAEGVIITPVPDNALGRTAQILPRRNGVSE